MNKLELLQEELRNYGKVAIAYSGGVDSNFLFHVALETLGKENVLPVLCRGAMMSKEDIEGALELRLPPTQGTNAIWILFTR